MSITLKTLNECDGRFSAVIPEAAGTPGRGLLLASPLGTDSYCLEIVPGIVGVPDVNKLLYRLLLLPRHFLCYLRSKETFHAAKGCFIFVR